MTAEQSLKIPLSDGKFAYAKLRGDWSQPLVVVAHGFNANMDRIIPYETSKFLSEHGYSVLRFNFYGASDDARKLIDTTLTRQSQDLRDVIAYVHTHSAHAVHVMGHSYGGLTILMSAQLKIDSALLIDPSHPKIDFTKRASPINGTDTFRFPGKGVDYIIGHQTITEFTNLKPSHFLPNYRTPSLIVSAAAGPLAATNREYATALQDQTTIKLVEVAGAEHTFDTDEALEQLLKAALDWLHNHTKTE